MNGDNPDTESAKSKLNALVSNAADAAAGSAAVVMDAASTVGTKISQVATGAMTLAGDLNGDGKVDEEDARLAREYAAGALSATAEEAGQLAQAIVRAPLTKDVATYAAVGAVIALPLPVIGSALGAAVGAGLGLLRNFKRNEPASVEAPKDAVAELERLHGLKEKGILTEDEFLAQKRKLLR